jgi:NADPH:quinone reductase-like Zn-dependent oxidoreductase
MAKAFGAKVIATARGPEKTQACVLLGADQAIDTEVEDFGALLKNSVDVILDIVGASYAAGNMEALKPRGRLVYISMVGGSDVTLPIFTIMRKQLVITGSTLRPRSADEKARIAAGVEKLVWPWIADGRIKSLVEQTFPLEEAAKAHVWMDDSHVGKCVLTV